MRSRAGIGAATGVLLVALSLSAFLLVSKSSLGDSNSATAAQKGKTMSVALEIMIGEKGDEVVRRSGLKIKRSQVSTALLYDASPDRTAVVQEVIVKTANHRVSLPLSNSILFYDDTVDPYGVEQIDLDLKLPKAPKGATNAAELETYDRAINALVTDVIERINKAGWKRYIAPSEPRIAGSETYAIDGPSSMRRYIPSVEIPSDLAASLTFEQWKKLKDNFNHTWRWYVDGVFIDLDYKKDPRDAASFPLVEDIKLSVQGERLFLASYDPKQSGNYERGVEGYKNSLPRWLEARKKEEAKARAAGLRVFEDWVDPPIGNIVVPGK